MWEIMRLAAASVASHPGELDANLREIESVAAGAAEAGAHLLLLPELSLSGFLPNHPVGDHDQWLRQALRGARQIAQPIPGPAVEQLVQIAARHRLMVCAGLFEHAGNLLYNTQILVGPDGRLGQWRKMHVPMFEMPFYQPGDAPCVVATPAARVGVNICFDAFLPESTRLLALQQVELVLFPFAADPPPGTAAAWRTWSASVLACRCRENGVFGLACNYVGEVAYAGATQRFPGGMLAFDPRGQTCPAMAGSSEQLLVVEIHRQTLEEARAEPEYLFRFRRPELYGPLCR